MFALTLMSKYMILCKGKIVEKNNQKGKNMHFYRTVLMILFMVVSAELIESECADNPSNLAQHKPKLCENRALCFAIAYIRGDFKIGSLDILVHPYYSKIVKKDASVGYCDFAEEIQEMKEKAENYLKITDPKKQRIYKAVKFFIHDRDLDCQTPEKIKELVDDLGDSTDEDDLLKPTIEWYKNMAMYIKEGTIIKSNARMWLKKNEQDYLSSNLDKIRNNRKNYREALEQCNTNWFIAWSGTDKLALYPAEQVARDTNPANGGF